jgi:hypothetical protein
VTHDEAMKQAKAYRGSVIQALATLLHAANDLAPEAEPDKYDAWRALVMKARQEYDALNRLRALAPAAHGESATGEAALAAPGDGFRPWKEEAIRWFGQLRDICKGASVGGDTMADTVGLCAWAIKLLRAGNAASPPVPVAWGGAAARAATVKESDHG